MHEVKSKFFNLSTFYKILIANSFIIVIGAVGGTWLTLELSQRSALELIAIFVLSGVTLSILVNFFILKVAFLPLTRLCETVDLVYRGDLTARAVKSTVGDPVIHRLIGAFNSMLEEIWSSHMRLEEINLQLHERDRERRGLLEKVITAQEDERKRIARELHDDTIQALTSLIIGLRLASDLTETPQAREKNAELRALAAGTLDRVRRLSIELRPSLLDDLGLASAVQRYATEYSSKTGINVDCALDDLGRLRLTPEVEVTIFRIIQEGLTNAAKHAGASVASVIFALRDSALVIIIDDDGKGFDVDKVMAEAHEKRLGLSGMRERASLINAKLAIESRPGDGTTLFLELPVKPIEELHYEQDKSTSRR
ncbi:MAG: sensor histidine kinase [Dehalococcoidia bacterium]|nr:sensor histidine kinase [Dehalococcoidia bacterium]